MPSPKYCYNVANFDTPIDISTNASNLREKLELELANKLEMTDKEKTEFSIVHFRSDTDECSCSDYEDINSALVQLCGSSAGLVVGLASLNQNDVEFSTSQITICAESPDIKGFVLGCNKIAKCLPGYESLYVLLELCAILKKPVLLESIGSASKIEELLMESSALCQLLKDGVFDNIPDLKVVLQADTAVPMILQQLRGDTSSHQKHPTKYYFRKNIFIVSDCSDESYIRYLLKEFGDTQILYGSPSTGAPSMPSIGQLSHKKLMSLNAKSLFCYDDTKVWHVDTTKVTIIDHRCVQLLSSKLRNKDTDYKDFMLYGDRLMTILAEEALARVPTVFDKDIETPTGVYRGLEDVGNVQLCVVSIIRSGDILLEAVRKLVPGIRVGKILIQRDEESKDKRAMYYYHKLPSDIKDCYVLVVDPMIATGGSFIAATDVLVASGVKPKNVMFVNLFACEEGLANLQSKYPDIQIVTFSIDEGLNEHKYIVPGVGDFGDRYYGTN